MAEQLSESQKAEPANDHTLDEYWRFANAVVRSGMAPKGMQQPDSVLVAIQMGAEVGLTPMAALQNIAVINGRPSVWGDAMLAICRSSGVFDEAAFEETIEERDGKIIASCTVRRLPNGKPVTRTFSMDDAKQAGLAGKPGPWQQYPKRMLQMRARSWALRDTFPDILRGLNCAEEIIDIEPEQQPAELKDVAKKMTPAAAAERPAPAEAVADEHPAEAKSSDGTLFDAPKGKTRKAK